VLVIGRRVDVDRCGGKIKGSDIVLSRENDPFGSAISFELQQIGKARSIKEGGNPEGGCVGGRDDRLATR